MEQPSLSDRYMMIGLRLTPSGRLCCMFCNVHGIHGGNGVVEVHHREWCKVIELYAPNEWRPHGQSLDAKSCGQDEREGNGR